MNKNKLPENYLMLDCKLKVAPDLVYSANEYCEDSEDTPHYPPGVFIPVGNRTLVFFLIKNQRDSLGEGRPI